MMRNALAALPKDVPVRVNFPHGAARVNIGESQKISILKQPCEQASASRSHL